MHAIHTPTLWSTLMCLMPLQAFIFTFKTVHQSQLRVFYRHSASLLLPPPSLALHRPGLRSPLQPVIGQMGTKGRRGWAQIDTGSEGAGGRKGPDTRSPGKRTKDGNLSSTLTTASFSLAAHSSSSLAPSPPLAPSSFSLLNLHPAHTLFPSIPIYFPLALSPLALSPFSLSHLLYSMHTVLSPSALSFVLSRPLAPSPSPFVSWSLWLPSCCVSFSAICLYFSWHPDSQPFSPTALLN